MQPQVAIIIPCRNEEKYIARCLDSVLANDYPHHLLDIVVVDGMSDDRTCEIVLQYANQHGCIRLLDNPDRIKPIALNLGIANTTAEVVMRIDAHALYARNYIPILAQGLFEHHCDNIGGIRETDAGLNTWSQAVAYAISHPFAVGNALYRTGVSGTEVREVDTVFCGCYRRDVFDRIGVFNEKLIRTQDREFNERLRANGGVILLDPAARCTYFPRTNWWGYSMWNFEGSAWLYYASRFTETHMTSWRNWIPGLFVLWHMLTFLSLAVSPLLTAVMAIPIGLYWVLNTFISGSIALTDGQFKLMPYMMYLFAATHYGYGLGSIFGVISAWWQGKEIADCSPKRLPEFKQAAA